MAAQSPTTDRGKLKPPPLQTSLGQQANVQAGTPPASPRPHTPAKPYERQAEVEESAPPTKPGHQRFVLTDPVAFRYLEEDSSTTVLDRRRQLTGYECYIVEQWTVSRTHPTFMITTYTGDSSHVVIVGVLSVPTDESVWSPRLRVYFKALNQYHARRRDTPLGILMVTNLSGFPSSLTVIPVQDGDVRKHRFDFFVNEDLKRLGCSGRVGLSLAQPAMTTTVKFHQLYRTSDKNDIYKAVIELVKLCQSALLLFNKLEVDYADGLLCDMTERAINDWWVEIGSEHYNIEPHDGILGPTTVAGLLGMLMGARNRLHAVNAPVSKDPFDVESMKRAINTFQKQQKMARTRRLDRRTLDRLHKATQKAADKERWAMPKAVKSTVAELSGKGGEMGLDAVGRRDRAGIAEIETVDIDRFVQLLYGERAKWLWLGKPLKKSKAGEENERLPEDVQDEPQFGKALVFKPDEHGGFTWTSGRRDTTDGKLVGKRDQDREIDEFNRSTPAEEGDESEEAKTSMFKRAATLKDDAKSGLGKVRGAVGLRGHKSKPSTDEASTTSPVEHNTKIRRPLLRRAHSSPMSGPNSPKGQGEEFDHMPAVAELSDRLNVVLGKIGRTRTGTASSRPHSMVDVSHDSLPPSLDPDNHQDSSDRQKDSDYKGNGTEHSRNATATASAIATASVAGSIYDGIDLNETLPTGPETEAEISNLLRRTISYNQYVHVKLQPHTDEAFPRHLSFSLAEDSVLNWASIIDDDSGSLPHHEPAAQLASEELLAKEAKQLRSLVTVLQSQTGPWTSSQISRLQSILQQTERDQDSIENDFHEPHLQGVRELQIHSEGVLRGEKERLEEGVKEIEMFAAKLEYEIDGLRSRVEDAQAGVSDYEKGVARVEERVAELEKEGEKKGWLSKCGVQ